jgi:hypothetical protein
MHFRLLFERMITIIPITFPALQFLIIVTFDIAHI